MTEFRSIAMYILALIACQIEQDKHPHLHAVDKWLLHRGMRIGTHWAMDSKPIVA